MRTKTDFIIHTNRASLLARAKVNSFSLKAKIKEQSGFKSVSKQRPSKNNQSTAPTFACRFCSAQYESSVRLGDHTSRAHPGNSQDYRKKQETRKHREPKREALREAQRIFAEEMGKNPKEKSTEVRKIYDRLFSSTQIQ